MFLARITPHRGCVARTQPRRNNTSRRARNNKLTYVRIKGEPILHLRRGIPPGNPPPTINHPLLRRESGRKKVGWERVSLVLDRFLTVIYAFFFLHVSFNFARIIESNEFAQKLSHPSILRIYNVTEKEYVRCYSRKLAKIFHYCYLLLRFKNNFHHPNTYFSKIT